MVCHLPQHYGAITSAAILPGQQALGYLVIPRSSLRRPPAPTPHEGCGSAKGGSQQHPAQVGLTPHRNGIAPPAMAPWHPRDPGKPQERFILADSITWGTVSTLFPHFSCVSNRRTYLCRSMSSMSPFHS